MMDQCLPPEKQRDARQMTKNAAMWWKANGGCGPGAAALFLTCQIMVLIMYRLDYAASLTIGHNCEQTPASMAGLEAPLVSRPISSSTTTRRITQPTNDNSQKLIEDTPHEKISNTHSMTTTSRAAAPFDFASIVGDGTLSCKDLQAQVQSGDLVDPNQGQLYSRELVAKPPFQMAVHNEQYDPVRWKTIYKKGKYYEGHVLKRFTRVLKNRNPTEGNLIVDVGTNIGYYTCLSRSLGPNNKVVSFEVNPLNILRLCESLDLNEWHNDVAIFHRGVFSKHGEILPIDIPVDNPGKASIVTQNARLKKRAKKAGTYTTTVTLDTFAEERKWFDMPQLTVAILKIDVEGVEPRIIEGAQRLLKSGIVENIFTEMRFLRSEEAGLAFQILTESGYVVVDTDQEKKLTPEETQVFIQQQIKEKPKGTVDLWFRRVEVTDPFAQQS